MSHYGTRNAVRVMRSVITGSEAELAAMLDSGGHALAVVGWHGFAHRLYHATALVQDRLGRRHRRCTRDFEFTLSVAVIGRRYTGWLAVGDSPLVACRHGITGLVAEPDVPEFANMTEFVTTFPATVPVCRSGIIPAAGLKAVAAMSDGTATRLIHLQARVPAAATREIMARVAEGYWSSHTVRRALQDPSWDQATGDDRSLALLAAATNPARSACATASHATISCHGPCIRPGSPTMSSARSTARDNAAGCP